MAYSCCFSLGGNLDLKSFITSTPGPFMAPSSVMAKSVHMASIPEERFRELATEQTAVVLRLC